MQLPFHLIAASIFAFTFSISAVFAEESVDHAGSKKSLQGVSHPNRDPSINSDLQHIDSTLPLYNLNEHQNGIASTTT